MAKIVELIVTEESIGNGTPEFPYSNVRTYWDKDGNIIAENREDIIRNQWYVKNQYIAIEKEESNER